MIGKPEQGNFARYAMPLLGLFFILVVAPSFYTVSLRDVFTFPKTLPIAVGTLLLWLGLTATGDISFDRELSPAIKAMSAAMLLSALFSVDYPLSILGPHQQQFYALLPMALCGLVYYAAANADDVPPSFMIMFAIIGGAIVSCIGLTQLGGHGFQSWSIQSGRIGSTFGSPIFLGAYIAILIPLAWALRSWTMFALFCVVLLATRSRGSILAAASGVMLIEYLRGERIWKVLRIIIPAAVVLCVLFFVRKTAHKADGQRLEIWLIALRAWRVRPLLGWGPDTFSLAFRQFMTQRFVDASNGNDKFIQLGAHNDVLQVLSTLGLVGLSAYAYLTFRIARLLRSHFAPEAVGIAGAAMALFVNAKFNPIPLAVMAVIACLIGSLDRRLDG